MDSYTVHRCDFGVYILGPVPIDDVVSLMKRWKKDGWTLCDSKIAEKLRASLVVTDAKGSAEWRASLGI